MNDAEIDKQIAALEGMIQWLRAQKGQDACAERMEADAKQGVPLPVPQRRPAWARATKAFSERGFRFDDWMVRRICANHPEWACALPGGWHVNLYRFLEFADRVERGDAKFVTARQVNTSLDRPHRLLSDR
ncbi:MULTISPECIES: hypothetical protein [unclassified Bradyrhizobium]|uniref:hypothetical protein n=1 Tax=unclassified Bradyrhizobium TaxID=2631580 RepID=UPI0028EBB7FF|nr:MULTISPECIES: hypothetical protein [unclassified Bradyrhizobium]